MTGSGNDGGTWVVARAQFYGGIGMGIRGEVHPNLYRGVGGIRKD
jgi:hypothetical protein